MQSIGVKVAHFIMVVALSLSTNTAARTVAPEPLESGRAEASQKLPGTPAGTAQMLLSAWRTKSRTVAARVASSETIDKLFSVRWRAMKFRGCTNREEGDIECRYYDRKNDLGLAVLLEHIHTLYRVTSISFSSEAL